jgi:hypothetical protein
MMTAIGIIQLLVGKRNLGRRTAATAEPAQPQTAQA